jgi:hypothetical protein
MDLGVGGEKLCAYRLSEKSWHKKSSLEIYSKPRSSHSTCSNTTMEDNHPQRERDSQITSNNGAIAIKRARTELSGPTEAQIQRKKEAERDYGRGRKIHGRSNIRFRIFKTVWMIIRGRADCLQSRVFGIRSSAAI